MTQRGTCRECGEPSATWIEDPVLADSVWLHINCEPGARAQLVALDGTTGNVDHLIAVRERAREQRIAEHLDEAQRVRELIERVRSGNEHTPQWFESRGITRGQLALAVRHGWVARVGRGYYARVA